MVVILKTSLKKSPVLVSHKLLVNHLSPFIILEVVFFLFFFLFQSQFNCCVALMIDLQVRHTILLTFFFNISIVLASEHETGNDWQRNREDQQNTREDQQQTRDEQLFNIMSNSSNLQMYICTVPE